MEDDVYTVKDMLAQVTAEMDQTQALIDTVRKTLTGEENIKRLDLMQANLDIKRARVRIFWILADIVEK